MINTTTTAYPAGLRFQGESSSGHRETPFRRFDPRQIGQASRLNHLKELNTLDHTERYQRILSILTPAQADILAGKIYSDSGYSRGRELSQAYDYFMTITTPEQRAAISEADLAWFKEQHSSGN